MVRNNNERLVYTVAEARQTLGISRGLMYEAIRTGTIPSVRIGRRILIPKTALERVLDKKVQLENFDDESLS
jgi:excisionase family DNA binding protein